MKQAFRLPRNQAEISYSHRVIESKNLYPLDRLSEIVKTQDIAKAKKDFDSANYGFDDMYLFKALAAYTYMTAHEDKDDKFVRDLSCVFINEKWVDGDSELEQIKKAYSSSGNDPNSIEDLALLKKKMHSYGLELFKRARQEIVERLYVLELLSFVCFDTFLPKLVGACPLYFGRPSIIFFIMHHQKICKLGLDKQKESEKILKRFILPDKRAMAKRTLPRWELYLIYKTLLKYIQPYHKAMKGGDKAEIKRTKESLSKLTFISRESIELIEKDFEIPSEAAHIIMEKEGKFKKAGTFQGFQMEMRQLDEKHSGDTLTHHAMWDA